jgi:hypothetical protein
MKRLLVVAGAIPLLLAASGSFAANDEATSPLESQTAAVQAEKSAEKAHCDHAGHRHVDHELAVDEDSSQADADAAERGREFRPSNVSRMYHHRR